ncbi:type IV secretion system protein [Duganella sp. BuS-21]|uniref:type IV secretion system protein n=1 Tax=Duganella sp. BuS-21 TaxID=2943848 RepID=UPI0035A6EDDC
MGIAQELDAAADLLLNNYIVDKSTAVCSILTPIALCALTIHFIQVGLSIARGQSHEPVKDELFRLQRTSFILMMALSAGIYQMYIVASFEGIGVAFIFAVSGKTGFAAQLDNLAEPFAALGDSLWSQATTGVFPHVGLLFAAAIVALTQIFLFSIGIGFYLLAKISVTLTMAVGPAFILCAIWPSTQKYAENWVGQTLNFVFLKVLVTCAIVMLTSFASQFAESMPKTVDAINVARSSCALLIACIALAIVMLSLPRLSSALFGGASVAGIGRTLTQQALHNLQPGRSRHSGGRQPRSNNSTRPGPGLASRHDNTISNRNPMYQRHALSNLQRHQSRRTA